MRGRLLRAVGAWALSLCVGWAAQAQTTLDTALPPVGPAVVKLAPVPDPLPEAITRQRQALAAQRTAIGQAEAAQQAACWQKFAVNACLSEARRARRQALEPLRQQELALNAQERLWRTEQRQRRLQGQSTDARDTP
ncbi:MAG: hypothetical protein RJB14_1473 [Pseudomonadota bacterium]